MEIKDTVSAATEVAKTAKEVLPQTTEQTDGALATLVGWFNNVVLYPVKKANITYRYKLECFEDDLYARAAQIPRQCLHNSNLVIAGPTLEALKYTYDEEKQITDMCAFYVDDSDCYAWHEKLCGRRDGGERRCIRITG